MINLQFGVNVPRIAMQFDFGGGPYWPWVPSLTGRDRSVRDAGSVKGQRWHKHTGVGFSPVIVKLDAESCWLWCPAQWHRAGGLCCFGVFPKEKHGRSCWRRGIPFVGGRHAVGRGGKQLSLGQESLAGVCTSRSHGRSVVLAERQAGRWIIGENLVWSVPSYSWS